MQSENGILLLFYIFLSHGNERKKNEKRGECCVLSTSTCDRGRDQMRKKGGPQFECLCAKHDIQITNEEKIKRCLMKYIEEKSLTFMLGCPQKYPPVFFNSI